MRAANDGRITPTDQRRRCYPRTFGYHPTPSHRMPQIHFRTPVAPALAFKVAYHDAWANAGARLVAWPSPCSWEMDRMALVTTLTRHVHLPNIATEYRCD
jgi:hypothetical protein